MFKVKRQRSKNDGMTCVDMESAVELMIEKLGDRNILKHLDAAYRGWNSTQTPPLSQLCAPQIIAVVDSFAPGCPSFLPSLAVLRKALRARHEEDPCLPGNMVMHAKVVAEVIKLILQVWRKVKTIEGKESALLKKAYIMCCIGIVFVCFVRRFLFCL